MRPPSCLGGEFGCLGGEAVPEPELAPCLVRGGGGHLMPAGDDHPPEDVALDVDATCEPPGEPVGDRRLARRRDAGNDDHRRGVGQRHLVGAMDRHEPLRLRGRARCHRAGVRGLSRTPKARPKPDAPVSGSGGRTPGCRRSAGRVHRGRTSGCRGRTRSSGRCCCGRAPRSGAGV
jgi:hypothetical protein